ncbi:hypothetical protein AOL_s00173g382 [Orbilia oligospora ATCC 24927]|uniref:Uncharacterized protein n=1 Tax=Arthrobotrys oligospora (strain ATCC 24927 / CBS 115.81 / DSM 1491) TaxID=756982 RepID=G1XPL4_ARTOA|nr:hypothetical protein AOL_s00173g382 [Orbilia oligospora ATCC 24927]EGX45281.1 hypothetical protein AOL_s00173g382 [Orbilia oligospora ATCC 24927]
MARIVGMVMPIPMPTAAPVEMAAAAVCDPDVAVGSELVVVVASSDVVVTSEVVDVVGRETEATVAIYVIIPAFKENWVTFSFLQQGVDPPSAQHQERDTSSQDKRFMPEPENTIL